MAYLAHISEDHREQTVLEHLEGTASLSRHFAAAFGAEEQGQLAGLAHDIGKYTTALNHLLSDREHISRIGDTTVMYWAEGGNPVYQSAFGMFAFGAQSVYTENDLREMVSDLLEGQPVQFDKTLLDPDRTFYILGLAPIRLRRSP